MKDLKALYKELLTALPRGAQRFLRSYSYSLAGLAVLDAIALMLVAAVIGPLATGSAVNLPVLGEITGTGAFVILGVVCLLIVTKGCASVFLLWFATRRFASYELAIGQRLLAAYLRAPWIERLKKNSTEVVRMTDGSVGVTVSGFLLPGSTLIGEVASLVVVIAVLAVAQPVLAVTTLLYLGAIGALLFVWVSKRSKQAGRVNVRYTMITVRLMTEIIGAMKELTLRGSTERAAGIVTENRKNTTRARANVQFLGQVPRFVLESAIVGGIVLVGAVGYVFGGEVQALTSVALFAVAGFRLAPAVVRLQSVIAQMTANTPHARIVLDQLWHSEQSTAHLSSREDLAFPENPHAIRVDGVTFKYSPDAAPAVTEVSLEIPFGQTVAFVGSSGSGKSTMIDLILGLIEPTEGDVCVDSTSITAMTKQWRSRVAYVPQEASIFDASIAQNVALTWDQDYDAERVEAALDQAQLSAVVKARNGGIEGKVGERGLALSGGQRQRIGIARALYNMPEVLVMDEATSALDTATEAAVSKSISELRGKATIILVAHRLSTVRHADRIFFMRDGSVIDQGTFDELVARVPEFALQARLAGLAS